jgi:hypothetical protein
MISSLYINGDGSRVVHITSAARPLQISSQCNISILIRKILQLLTFLLCVMGTGTLTQTIYPGAQGRFVSFCSEN